METERERDIEAQTVDVTERERLGERDTNTDRSGGEREGDRMGERNTGWERER